MKLFRLSVFLICLTSIQLIFAQERITQYDVEVLIGTDRSITVTEDITVVAEGNQIRHGITRSLPFYRISKGKEVAVKYQILAVERDGNKEPYHEEKAYKQRILYLGESDRFLSPGTYSYRIRYRVPMQIESHELFDQLYWNAIGTDVKFPIEKATCKVIFPAERNIIHQACYTGTFSSKESNCTFTAFQDIALTETFFSNTNPLQPKDGLTVIVSIDPGLMLPPSFWERWYVIIIMGIGCLILLLYYVITWSLYGQDPPEPTLAIMFDPPQNYSPADLSYISREKYHKDSLAASIISLAVKGYLEIHDESEEKIFSTDHKYQLKQIKKDPESLPLEEKRMYKILFGHSSTFSITETYQARVRQLLESHEKAILEKHKSFVQAGYNRKFLTAPIIIAIVFGGIAQYLFMHDDGFAAGVDWARPTYFLAVVGSLFAYAYLIKKPSPEKLLLQADIGGFQMYLKNADISYHGPELSPKQFERLLPYAVSLGVDYQWADTFSDVLANSQHDSKANSQQDSKWSNNPYSYYNSRFCHNFSRTVTYSSTPPSSSSGGGGRGGGGGGFSGGGGGGGGVGGW